jgi:formylglycine-generating enzyme required for sulfatase activity
MSLKPWRLRARALRHPLFLATAATVTLPTQLAADTFGSGANQFDIDFVPIGNPGNAPDTTGAPNPAGAVPYGYRMGTYEVSRGMIEKANAPVASGGGNLGITMADMTPLGGNGANRPATGVSWYEAAALVNWLNTSTGHQPAYNLSGASLSLWPSGDAWQAGGENLYRHKDAYYFLPSENEWYKAAYYDGVAGVYYDYPTGSDSAPTAAASGTGVGTAVYSQPLDQGPADIANAGGLSPYGTMGQGGNVWEWMESAYTPPNDSGSELRGLRGANWSLAAFDLDSSGRFNDVPAFESISVGFRVAAVPEPLESAGVIGLAALGFALWRRRGSL